jgi:flagellar motor component MotA
MAFLAADSRCGDVLGIKPKFKPVEDVQMSFLKKLHPVFQFVIIGLLFALYLATAIHFHVGFVPSALLLIICAALGASVTTHEENTLKYNLEDVEEDELAKIEKYATAEGKAAIAKLRALAGKAKKAL